MTSEDVTDDATPILGRSLVDRVEGPRGTPSRVDGVLSRPRVGGVTRGRRSHPKQWTTLVSGLRLSGRPGGVEPARRSPFWG